MRSKLSQIFNLIITAAVLSVDLSGGTQLDIIPDLNGLMVCNSSVVFTCTLQTAPLIAMAWHIDGTPVAECTASQCGTPFPSMPSHHTTTFISGTTTELRINPVKLSDNYTVSCTDGTEASIVTSVKVGALPLTYSVTTQGDETNITIVSSCVFSPRSSVKFRIQNNNTGDALNLVNGNNVLTPTEYVACTDAENPNCGGSNTAKAKAILTITTQATGTPTEISIVAVQSDEDLSPPQYIGSYILKVPEDNTTQTAPITSTGPTTSLVSSTIMDTNSIPLSTTSRPTIHTYTTLNEPVIYLISGCLLLTVISMACVIHLCYIIHRRHRRKNINNI